MPDSQIEQARQPQRAIAPALESTESIDATQASMAWARAAIATAQQRWFLATSEAGTGQSAERIISELIGRDAETWRESQTSPELIEAGWRERRQRSTGAARKDARDHLAHYADRLSEMADRNARRAVTEMLAELSQDQGVMWSDIAAALRISVPALRKWRKNTSGTTPENHRKLAQLTAFYAVLDKLVASPARWMLMPIVEGHNVTPADVYSPEHAERLLDLAAGNVGTTAEGVLDAIAPGWRDTWRSDYEIFEAADGELSMRPRQNIR